MKYLFSISLLLLMLMPEVSVSAIMDHTSQETTSNDYRFQKLEEEKEIEITTSFAVGFSDKSCGPSGGLYMVHVLFDYQIPPIFTTKTNGIKSHWVFISKNPRYIQFCCLKLDC